MIGSLQVRQDVIDPRRDRNQAIWATLDADQSERRVDRCDDAHPAQTPDAETGCADAYGLDRTAILFADVVGLMQRSALMAPEKLVGFLNHIFSTFDEPADNTIWKGSRPMATSFMVAEGLPTPCIDPVRWKHDG